MLNQIEQQRRDKMITELPDAETLLQRRRCVIIMSTYLLTYLLSYSNVTRQTTSCDEVKMTANIRRVGLSMGAKNVGNCFPNPLG